MTSIVGNAAAQAAFATAVASGSLHHGWLIAGPEGVGKARFTQTAAAMVLAAGRGQDGDAAAVERIRQHIEKGTDPDAYRLQRLINEKGKNKDKLARSIKVDQVREMIATLHTRPTIGTRRAIVIDAVDDLEKEGANALLKVLEEPPDGTVLLLVSHAPGRLLPTIRSRCRVLRFDPLNDADVETVIREQMPELPAAELAALVAVGEGSPGRALSFAGLDLGALDRDMTAIANSGDPDNAIRGRLAKSLAGKNAQPRYEAFMEVAPSFIAARARTRQGDALVEALDAYAAARDLTGAALGLSLDAAGSVFEMAGLIARLAPASPIVRR